MRISDWSSDVCSSDLFIDVAKGLIAAKYTSAGKISIEGRSAGGQVMGAVYNQAPELWGAVLAGVPFVDVINTMVDETLPLTPRSEERRVGKECVSTCRYRWSQFH